MYFRLVIGKFLALNPVQNVLKQPKPAIMINFAINNRVGKNIQKGFFGQEQTNLRNHVKYYIYVFHWHLIKSGPF